ncbi:MAG: protein kinase [candidate division WS1 bacterium]|jgi:hypothetical protein|nr:protein kinase [candidate division WS1 bacterium]
MPQRGTNDLLRAGQRFASYRIQGPIGQGPCFAVYHAVPLSGCGEYAIKVLRPEFAAEPEWLAWFQSAGDALMALNHPAAVRIHERGVVADQHFLVADYAGIRSIAWMLYHEGIGCTTVVEVCRATSDLLLHCHQLPQPLFQIAFRPTDVFVDEKGRVTVADTALLKSPVLDVPDTTDPALRAVPAIECMAPELLAGGGLTMQSDLYSLGLLVFRMMRGSLPATQAAERLAAGAPVEEILPKRGPANLVESLRRTLSLDPADRFPDALEFRATVEQLDRERMRTRLSVGLLPWEMVSRTAAADVPVEPVVVAEPMPELEPAVEAPPPEQEAVVEEPVRPLFAAEPEPELEPAVEAPPPEQEAVVQEPVRPVVAAETEPEPVPALEAPPPEPEPVVAEPVRPVVAAEPEPEPTVEAPPPEPEPVVAELVAPTAATESEPAAPILGLPGVQPELVAGESALLREVSALTSMAAAAGYAIHQCETENELAAQVEPDHPAPDPWPAYQAHLVAAENELLRDLALLCATEASNSWHDASEALEARPSGMTGGEAPPEVQPHLVAAEEILLRDLVQSASTSDWAHYDVDLADAQAVADVPHEAGLSGLQPDLVAAEEALLRALAEAASASDWSHYDIDLGGAQAIADVPHEAALSGLQPDLVAAEDELLLGLSSLSEWAERCAIEVHEASIGWLLDIAPEPRAAAEGIAPSEWSTAEETLLRELSQHADAASMQARVQSEADSEAVLTPALFAEPSAPPALEGVQIALREAEDAAALLLAEAAEERTRAATAEWWTYTEGRLQAGPPSEPRLSDLWLLPPSETTRRHSEQMASLEAWVEGCAAASASLEWTPWPEEALPLGGQPAHAPMFPLTDIVGHPGVWDSSAAFSPAVATPIIKLTPAPVEAANLERAPVAAIISATRDLGDIPPAELEASEAVIEVATAGEGPLGVRRDTALPVSDFEAQDMVIAVSGRREQSPIPRLRDLAGNYHTVAAASADDAEVIGVAQGGSHSRGGILRMIGAHARRDSSAQSAEAEPVPCEFEEFVDELRELSNRGEGDEAYIDALRRWDRLAPEGCHAGAIESPRRREVAALFELLAERVSPDSLGLSGADLRARDRLIGLLAELTP